MPQVIKSNNKVELTIPDLGKTTIICDPKSKNIFDDMLERVEYELEYSKSIEEINEKDYGSIKEDINHTKEMNNTSKCIDLGTSVGIAILERRLARIRKIEREEPSIYKIER